MMTATEIACKLADKFTSVKIKKTDLDAAERKMRGELIDKWEEKVRITFTPKKVKIVIRTLSVLE